MKSEFRRAENAWVRGGSRLRTGGELGTNNRAPADKKQTDRIMGVGDWLRRKDANSDGCLPTGLPGSVTPGETRIPLNPPDRSRPRIRWQPVGHETSREFEIQNRWDP